MLPIDPINSNVGGQFYTYVSGWELTAPLGTKRYRNAYSVQDGGISAVSFEFGANLRLTPLSVKECGRDESLIGYWGFDETPSMKVYDYSGNNNTMLLFNNPTWLPTAKIGGGLYFNGIDQYGIVSDSISIDTITKEVTLMAWIRPDTGTGYTRVVHKFAVDESQIPYELVQYTASQYVQAGVATEKGKVFQNTYVGSISPEQWYHVAFTYDGSNVQVYLNGQLIEGKKQKGTLLSNLEVLYFARRYSEYFQGAIDEVRLYNRTLSKAEIQALYIGTNRY
ncbi:MAG: LamG domain-containing protein [bacterium]